ncbi:MAG: hypothetical protein WC107_00665 [Patescibacteria group bacterium]
MIKDKVLFAVIFAVIILVGGGFYGAKKISIKGDVAGSSCDVNTAIQEGKAILKTSHGYFKAKKIADLNVPYRADDDSVFVYAVTTSQKTGLFYAGRDSSGTMKLTHDYKTYAWDPDGDKTDYPKEYAVDDKMLIQNLSKSFSFDNSLYIIENYPNNPIEGASEIYALANGNFAACSSEGIKYEFDMLGHAVKVFDLSNSISGVMDEEKLGLTIQYIDNGSAVQRSADDNNTLAPDLNREFTIKADGTGIYPLDYELLEAGNNFMVVSKSSDGSSIRLKMIKKGVVNIIFFLQYNPTQIKPITLSFM